MNQLIDDVKLIKDALLNNKFTQTPGIITVQLRHTADIESLKMTRWKGLFIIGAAGSLGGFVAFIMPFVIKLASRLI